MMPKRMFIIAFGIGALGLLSYLSIDFIRPSRLEKNPAGVFDASPILIGTREYRSPIFRFSLFYPHDLQVWEHGQGSSDTTIVFEDPRGDKGFQIFVIPYSEDQITPEQFKKDVPSGVMKDPVDIMLDGVRATMFFSKDPILGETREVWFIKNGFLYEVTTYKALDAWLASILSTWKFLDY